jgi:diacylglycerol kinase family enzyme
VANVLLVSNAYAGRVSPRKKEVIAKALAADCKLEVVDTASRNHASELSADAVDRGFSAIVVFGGDGTVNEVAQSLVGTDVALGILPGGSTNVMARALGIPLDPIDATAFLGRRLASDTRRRINVGRVDERYFLFSAGMGLDAEVVRRVEAAPEKKRKYGEWWFVVNALKTALTQYRGAEPRITLAVEAPKAPAKPARVVLAVCCNGRPFTYFKRFPVDVCPGASLDSGLDVLGFTRIHATTIPRLVWSLFMSRSHPGWRNARYHHDVESARLEADIPLPVQVDGDYIGERTEASLSLMPSALDLLV